MPIPASRTSIGASPRKIRRFIYKVNPNATRGQKYQAGTVPCSQKRS
jgi:hypothetical protein